MSNLTRSIRQTFTVARRDFVATVFAPTFLIFLLTPILMIGLAMLSGLGAASAASGGEARLRIVVVAAPDRAAQLTAIDRQLRLLFPGRDGPPVLRIDAPTRDVSAQARAMFEEDKFDVVAVLYGPLETPTILHSPTPGGWISARYLGQMAEQTLRSERAGGTTRLSNADVRTIARNQASVSGRRQLGYFSVVGLFVLTLMLSGQAVGTMAEERSNKVIEVLAAAVPLESVFIGKLIGLFGTASLFILFWGTLIANVARFLPPSVVDGLGEFSAAVGYPAFPLLFVAYFVMAYMLLGAVFVSIGSLASSQRELQMLSLPITIFQVVVMSLAATGAFEPDGWIAIATQVFPFSSPFAMAARAANQPELWPHFVALGWQAIWVGIIITLGARIFRRGVLKSGNPKWRFWSKPEVA